MLVTGINLSLVPARNSDNRFYCNHINGMIMLNHAACLLPFALVSHTYIHSFIGHAKKSVKENENNSC